VAVEQRELFLHSADNAGMTVPDQRHVVVDVEVGAPGVVVEVLHPAANDFQRALVRNAEVFSEQRAPLFECFVWICFLRWEAIRWNSKEEIGIGREAGPDSGLRSVGHAGKISAKVE